MLNNFAACSREQGTARADNDSVRAAEDPCTFLWSLSTLPLNRKTVAPSTCPPAYGFKGEESQPVTSPGPRMGAGPSGQFLLWPLLPFPWIQSKSTFQILTLRARNSWGTSGGFLKQCCYDRHISCVCFLHSDGVYLTYPCPDMFSRVLVILGVYVLDNSFPPPPVFYPMLRDQALPV